MKKANFRTRKEDGDKLGHQRRQKIDKNPAPKDADRESETTPPENEVYIDIEPDELHIEDEPLDVDEKEK